MTSRCLDVFGEVQPLFGKLKPSNRGNEELLWMSIMNTM